MIKAKVYFINRQKEQVIDPALRQFLRTCIKTTLEVEGFADFFEVNVTFVNDTQIQKINAQYRQIDAPTDVLSFPMGEDGLYDINPENGAYLLGDVVLNVNRIRSQAQDFGHSFEREAGYLTVHSILHLCGYDHVDEGQQKAAMRAKEEQVLTKLKLFRE